MINLELHNVAEIAARDNDTLLIYAPDLREIELPAIAAHRAWCFDPRDGLKRALKTGSRYTPKLGVEDWVLILETD